MKRKEARLCPLTLVWRSCFGDAFQVAAGTAPPPFASHFQRGYPTPLGCKKMAANLLLGKAPPLAGCDFDATTHLYATAVVTRRPLSLRQPPLRGGDSLWIVLARILCGCRIACLDELIQIRLIHECGAGIDKPGQDCERILCRWGTLRARLLMV